MGSYDGMYEVYTHVYVYFMKLCSKNIINLGCMIYNCHSTFLMKLVEKELPHSDGKSFNFLQLHCLFILEYLYMFG